MARRGRSRRSISAIFIRYMDQESHLNVISVRTSWQLDETLRELFKSGCKPMSILLNGERYDAYNPDQIDIAIRYLEHRGYEVNRFEIFGFNVFHPNGDSIVMSPKQLIDGALKIRSKDKAQSLQEAESGDIDSQ